MNASMKNVGPGMRYIMVLKIRRNQINDKNKNLTEAVSMLESKLKEKNV